MKTPSTDSTLPSPSTSRTWVPLGLATLSATAHAGVFYSNFPDVVRSDPNPSSFNTIDVTGSVIFNIAAPSITAIPGFIAGSGVQFRAFDNIQKKGKSIGSFRSPLGNVNISQNLLTIGAVINGATGWTSFTPLADSLTDAFTGVRVETSPGSGSYHYGWIRFSTGPSAGGVNEATTITLKDAAFETTPDVAILAGAGAVPEASGWATLGFLGLAGGAEAFRRARRASQSKAKSAIGA